MVKFYVLILFMFFTLTTYAEIKEDNSCKLNQKYKLSVFSKNDAKFISNNCEIAPDNQYVESFLIIQNKKLYLNRVKGRVGNGEGAELVAVSLYRKKSTLPILITLYSETYCCYPQPSGKLYTIDLYNIVKNGNNISLKPITDILGDNSSGLEGVSDDYMHFKFKDIASIKKWLDKNYK